MRVLVAPDSFKGSLDPLAVAQALRDGWLRGRPTDVVTLDPARGRRRRHARGDQASGGGLGSSLPPHAEDPLGGRCARRFLRRGDGARRGARDGLRPVARADEERDAMAASTFGTGLVLAAAIGLGAARSCWAWAAAPPPMAARDCCVALGARFLDERGDELPPGGGALGEAGHRSTCPALSPLLAEVSLTIASDVTNPLARRTAVQPRPTGRRRAHDEARCACWTRTWRTTRTCSRRRPAATSATCRVPARPAARPPGCWPSRIASRRCAIRPGVEVVMELTDFDARLADCDLVLTGEGRIDEQTAFGKTALGVARRARRRATSLHRFGGGVTVEGIDALAALGAIVVPTAEQPATLEEQIAAGRDPLVRAAERAARLVSLGARDQTQAQDTLVGPIQEANECWHFRISPSDLRVPARFSAIHAGEILFEISRAWNDDYAANIDFTPARPRQRRPMSVYAPNRWGNRPTACGWLKILGAALQADGGNEVRCYGLKHPKEKREPWTILLDWTFRSRRPASALWMRRARLSGK